MHHDVVAARAGIVVRRRRDGRCRRRRRRRPRRDRRRPIDGAAPAPIGGRPRRTVGRRGRPGRAPTSPRSSSATASGSTRHVRTPSSGAAELGRRTARENVADLVDRGSFVEYGPLVVAAQRRRRSARRPRRQHAGRRDDRRHRHRQRRPVRRPRGTLRGGVVRLHRARRHAGNAQPPQEGPPVRAGRRAAPAGRAVHRGRRRTAGRLGGARSDRAGLPGVPAHRRAVRARAARRRQRRLLLRRQRRPARLLRRRHRHRGLATSAWAGRR